MITVQMVTHLIDLQKPRIRDFVSLGDWWDNLKSLIRSKSIDFSIQKRRKINSRSSSLTKQLIRAKSALYSGVPNITSTVANLESDLLSLVSQEAEGIKIRSRAEWIEKGEKPTHYFFRLEQKRADQNSFTSLIDANGVEKFSQQDFETILVDFYSSLFSKDSLDMQIQTELIDDLELSLNDLERDQCEGLFIKEELLFTLKSLRLASPLGQTVFLSSFTLLSGSP